MTSYTFSSPLEGERANGVSGGGAIDTIIVGYAPHASRYALSRSPSRGAKGRKS